MVEALRLADPRLAVAYVGRAHGPEASIVRGAGIDYAGLHLGSMGSSRLSSLPRLLARLPLAYGQAVRMVRRFRPDVVMATGGYVCVPIAVAAQQRGVPVALLEQNLLPGQAVRLLAPRVRAVATSFSETGEHLGRARVVCTGNPVRRSFSSRAGRPLPEGSGPTLLVMGGSQGARHLNQVLLEILPTLLSELPQLEVEHITGRTDHERVLEEARALGISAGERYRPLTFVDQLADLISAANLVVMRAGGSSLAEVACVGRAMALVPYPHAGEHQAANAAPFAAAGAARVIPDHELEPKRLLDLVREILRDQEEQRRMARASSRLARPQAADDVAALLVRLARERP